MPGTITTRLAIDELRSARARRESYVGEWLLEPIAESSDDDPAARAETADSLSLAFLVLLESLTPEQRAALPLHDVFHCGYDEVAEIVGTSEGNARQFRRVSERELETTELDDWKRLNARNPLRRRTRIRREPALRVSPPPA
jgi:DNA-directed RNA polymerase specialized sigma24 family protein